MNAIKLYRIGRWFYERHIPFIPTLIYGITFLIFNSSIPPSCEIGAGSKFSYGGIAVVLHRRCKIGKGVNIGHCVTVGGTFGSDVPVIGDNVWIAPGSRIMGTVKVGNNVILGANCVVTKDVPDNCIVAGVPAKVLRTIPPGALDALKGSLKTEEEMAGKSEPDPARSVRELENAAAAAI